MSAHNGRSKGRHPDAPREQFEVAHITFVGFLLKTKHLH